MGFNCLAGGQLTTVQPAAAGRRMASICALVAGLQTSAKIADPRPPVPCEGEGQPAGHTRVPSVVAGRRGMMGLGYFKDGLSADGAHGMGLRTNRQGWPRSQGT